MGYFKKLFCLFVLILLVFVLPSYGATEVIDVYNEIYLNQITNQNNLVLLCYFPFLGNTDAWTAQGSLRDMFDELRHNDYCINVNIVRYDNYSSYYVEFFNWNEMDVVTTTWTSIIDGQDYNCNGRKGTVIRYVVNYYPSNNTFNVTRSTVNNRIIRTGSQAVKSDLLIDFLELINGGGNLSYTGFLSSILSYLSSIDTRLTSTQSIVDDLGSIISANNVSSQLNTIDNSINDVETAIQETTEVLEDVKDNISETNDKIDDLKDTITDDTVESTASDLPSTSVTDPTASGIDNIFTSIYNAFCTGTAQDIVFPIPFTGKDITLSPYYVRDMLNNNGAGWVYNLIQAFWGYLIGRFIVLDVMKKITKIKSGNIEELETNNIKGDML